jgi:Tfp pilus assembly major pilin PilA
MHRTGIWVVVMALAAAACSGGEEPVAAQTTTTTTTAPTTTTTTTAAPTTTATSTTTIPTTTTTLYPGPWSPLNGTPVEADAIDRRVIAVKIDNHPSARPQTGLDQADAVYELIVEGGLTRFIALFQTVDPEKVGPIRSGRPTDPTLIAFLDAPLQISGAQSWIISRINATGVKLIGDNGTTTFRDSSRSAPHNLYGEVEEMRAVSDGRGYPDESPDPMFLFGDTPADGIAATAITLDWSSRPEVRWTWDGEAYLRWNDTVPHTWITAAGEEEQIAVPTLLVLTARQYTATPPGKGSSVPALDTVGSGQALLFHSGRLVEGTWQRDAIDEPFTLELVDGAPMVVPPGQLWISVFPSQQRVTWDAESTP